MHFDRGQAILVRSDSSQSWNEIRRVGGVDNPATGLHFSLDECKTWSQNVPIDRVGGAYPSIVNLQDGSVLIVYYEEGAGSSIRWKRFRATKSGIEWLHP